MTKLVYYGLAGGLAAVIALSLIKRKPSYSMVVGPVKVLPGPKTYTSAPGDLVFLVSKRFGTTGNAILAMNKQWMGNLTALGNALKVPGTSILLPPGLADTGATTGAKGTAT